MKAKFFIAVLFSLSWVLAIAQVVGHSDSVKIYGLFIGISDYKYFPPLKYAHKDAEDFKNFILSNENSIDYQVFKNENATRETIFEYLNELTDKVKPNDKVYIFFSGHGDVENRVISENGYLIAYDTKLDHYNIKGISTNDINHYLAILVNEKKAQVCLFVDACRSAKINKIENGPSLSLTALMSQRDDLAKFASCKENQKSMERHDLNDGQGLFTYALIKGLSCLSDRDGDKLIQHEELRRFILDEVKRLSKNSQTPMINGDPDMQILSCLVSPSISQERVAATDFKFSRPQSDISTLTLKDSTSALNLDTIYERAKQWIRLNIQVQQDSSPLIDSKFNFESQKNKREYVWNLQRFVEEKLLTYVESSPSQLAMLENENFIISPNVIDSCMYFFQLIDTLLVKNHPMKKKNTARSLFFKSMLENNLKIKNSLLIKSIQLEPDAAYTYFELGRHQMLDQEYQSALINLNMATNVSPNSNIAKASELVMNKIQKVLADFPNSMHLNIDKDADGTPDITDKCPDKKGFPQFSGCPDNDSDGVPDIDDDCPDMKGLPRFSGCPDNDLDGVPDNMDKCPGIKGFLQFSGCPDSDADGVSDGDDDCPHEMGLPQFSGCPDTDNDGVPDKDDFCPNQLGEISNQGCPLPLPSTYSKDMLLIRGSSFVMGDIMNDREDFDRTINSQKVNDFLLAKNELTFDEYDAFCRATNRKLADDEGWGRGKRPVINVSWYDAIDYCNWRSEKENLRQVYNIQKNSGDSNNWLVTTNANANGYRLPTEAEWEYAARERGQIMRFGNGKNTAHPNEINFDGDWDVKHYSVKGLDRKRTVPVGSFSPNSLNIYDMSGNVNEWCWDSDLTYVGNSANDPSTQNYRIFHGGSWGDGPAQIRVASRGRLLANESNSTVGFRLARPAITF